MMFVDLTLAYVTKLDVEGPRYVIICNFIEKGIWILLVVRLMFIEKGPLTNDDDS